MDNVKVNLPKRFNLIYMYSRNTHNINDVFEQFVSTFNNVAMITRCDKSNTMELHLKHMTTTLSFLGVILVMILM